MDAKMEKIIITEYENGKSSLQLAKLLGISKTTILKLLRKKDITRKRDRCQKLDIKQEGTIFYIERICPKCGIKIKTTSKDKIICCRNYFNAVHKQTLCKSCSLESQMGEGNPFYGKKHTKETLEKISKSRKGKGMGDNNSMSNPKWRKKVSENLKKRWESGELEETRKKMSEHLKNTIRKGKIKSIIISKKEREMVKLLKKMKIDCVPSYRIDSKICDIFIPSMNLIIEYFGDYWHCNPSKYKSDYYNDKKGKTAKEIWEYDKMKVDLIKSYGYNLEIIWESELKYNNQKLIEIINKYDSKHKFAPEQSRKD